MNKTLLVTALSLAFGLNVHAQTTEPSTDSSTTVKIGRASCRERV